MISSNANAVGIIFPNVYDSLVPELTNVRLMASIPFAARYRMIDFVLSSMANSGIDNIAVMVNRNYQSLIDHLGSGREWDLVRKSGGLNMFPPFATAAAAKIYDGRVGILEGCLDYLRHQKEDYVILADCNLAINFNFNELIAAHKESGADITCVYQEAPLPEALVKYEGNDRGFFYTFQVEDGQVRKIFINQKEAGIKDFGMNIYIMGREFLIREIDAAYCNGAVFLERDVIMPQLSRLNVRGYKYDGYVARICDMKSYFNESMKLLDDHNLDALFSGNTIYTKVRDDNPTRYIKGSAAENVMVADGCVIEGDIENSILFRGVKVAKGAKVKNCILMQDTVVGPDADLEYVVADKDCEIAAGKKLKGTDTFPIYIAKGGKV